MLEPVFRQGHKQHTGRRKPEGMQARTIPISIKTRRRAKLRDQGTPMVAESQTQTERQRAMLVVEVSGNLVAGNDVIMKPVERLHRKRLFLTRILYLYI